jgi:hypothetical protein
MVKFLGWLVLLAGVFSLGVYVGRHPVEELRQRIEEVTRSVRDTTLGVERTMRLRQGLVDAKAHVIQAKSNLIDRNFGHAATDLGQALEQLEKADGAEQDAGGGQRVRPLIVKVKQVQAELSLGKAVKRARLDEIQKELDVLLAR